jgi:hypothetical protein
MNPGPKFLEKSREFLGKSMLQDGDGDIFERPGHDEIVY